MYSAANLFDAPVQPPVHRPSEAQAPDDGLPPMPEVSVRRFEFKAGGRLFYVSVTTVGEQAFLAAEVDTTGFPFVRVSGVQLPSPGMTDREIAEAAVAAVNEEIYSRVAANIPR